MAKAVSLVSGGIDSAVAAALALEQGMGLVFLHFDTVPLGNTKGREKTRKLAKALGEKFGKGISVFGSRSLVLCEGLMESFVFFNNYQVGIAPLLSSPQVFPNSPL